MTRAAATATAYYDATYAQSLDAMVTADPVHMTLDWVRRYRHMRMHICLHLLGSLIPAGVTGGAVGAEKGRLDFDAGDIALDKQGLTEQLNALAEAGHAVEIDHVDESVLNSQPGLVRTLSVQPACHRRGAATAAGRNTA